MCVRKTKADQDKKEPCVKKRKTVQTGEEGGERVWRKGAKRRPEGGVAKVKRWIKGGFFVALSRQG